MDLCDGRCCQRRKQIWGILPVEQDMIRIKGKLIILVVEVMTAVVLCESSKEDSV